MASILYSEVRKGMIIKGEGDSLHYVINRDLRTPGNLPSKLTLKLKNLKTGLVNDVRIHPEDKVEQAFLETSNMQYLYKDGDEYVFMDNATFEQATLREDLVGELMAYLRENDNVKVTSYEGKPLSVELPQTVELKVTEAEPAIKGSTATVVQKTVTVETGLKVQAPSFVGVGETIIIDTGTGKYTGRVRG